MTLMVAENLLNELVENMVRLYLVKESIITSLALLWKKENKTESSLEDGVQQYKENEMCGRK